MSRQPTATTVAKPTPPPLSEEQAKQRDALVGRLFGSCLGALDLVGIYLGHHLGYYQSLAAQGPATSQELAERTGTHERYAREWLEQHAVTGILQVDDARKDPAQRRFTLPAAHAEVLTQPRSMAHFVPAVRAYVGTVQLVPQVLEAYRTGGGVPWARMSQELVDAQAGFNEALFMQVFAAQQIPAVADVHARLQADPPAKVLDVACGAGWASIALAKAYPKAQVEGLDSDARAIAQAQRNAAGEGVGGRIRFEARDAASITPGKHDLVLLLECLHDLPHPVEVLRAVRNGLAPGGTVLVMEERAAEAFEVPSNDLERFLYGWSIGLCLPGGMGDKGAAGTGTLMRPATLRRYAEDAGFAGVEVLPIDNDPLRRWYRLVPEA